jgi:hypothetical protein
MKNIILYTILVVLLYAVTESSVLTFFLSLVIAWILFDELR